MNTAATLYPASSTPAPGPRAVPSLGANPEFEFLLACCNGTSRAELGWFIASVRFDWDRLLRLAEHHRLVFRVYEQLSTLDGVSPKFLESLRAKYQRNAYQALWLTSELIRTVSEFEARGIQALPYKGPVLSGILYADVTLRQFGDLDLLVHADDVPKAKAALQELGYTSSVRFTEREERAYLSSGYEFTFDSTHGRNLVELKWQILPLFYSVEFDVDAMFQRATTFSLGGHCLKTLCAEDLLLVLCVHAAKHGWSQLALLRDLGRFAEQRLDWVIVEKKSAELGIRRIVAVNFLLAHRLLGANLPEMVERCMRNDLRIESLAEEIADMLAKSAECDTESFGYFRLMMRLRERRIDRVRFLWRLAFRPTPGDWAAIRLPVSMFSFYRVVRMIRLGTKIFGAGRSGHEVA